MSEVEQSVKLINHTPNPERTVAAAARLCYSPVGADKLMVDMTGEEAEKLLNIVISGGHHSTLEHISFSFAIEGISRVTSHQLVRHRIASYSQQSQRYVRERDEPVFILPKRIYDLPDTNQYKQCFIKMIKDCFKEYSDMADHLINQGYTEKEAIEDARYILPNAAETKIVVTMNARSLLHFFNMRCCNRAQREIRDLANTMLQLVKEVAPIIFEYAGPDCISGECKEGEMSCGGN